MKNTQANPKQKQQAIPACPACSYTRGTTHVDEKGHIWAYVYVCGRCNGLFSNNLYLGSSYELVLPYMVADDAAVPEDRQRYFDFSGVGSKGTYRRHGWFDTASKRIVQVG